MKAIDHYRPHGDPQRHVEEVMQFIWNQFRISGMSNPNEKEVREALALTHDWTSSYWGLRYVGMMRGIDVIDLSGTIINTYHRFWGEYSMNLEDHESDGSGFYLHVKDEPSKFDARLKEGCRLNNHERKSLSDYIDHLIKFDSNFRVPRLNADELETVCWTYLMYLSAPMGDEMYFTLNPWYRDMKSVMDEWVIDRFSSPWKWIDSREKNQLNGGVVLIDVAELYGDFFSSINSYDRSDFYCEDDWLYYLKQCETDMDLVYPEDIIITGRDFHQCYRCNRRLRCTESTSYVAGEYELHQHYMCAHCREREVKQENIDESYSETLGSYFYRCPAVMLPEIMESNFHPELAGKILYDCLVNGRWNFGERPIEGSYSEIREIVEDMVRDRPYKVRHMAAYAITKNPCIAGRYANDESCKRLDYGEVERWYQYIKQQDYQEKLQLGEVKRSKFRLT